MIYKKPSVYWFQRNRISTEIISFLDSLPAEFEIVEPGFEIVEPGNVQVRWPDGVTREKLSTLAEWAKDDSIRALAAIAPVEKKKRKVWLWEKDHPHYTERSWTSNDIDRSGGGWRKVGECEVDA